MTLGIAVVLGGFVALVVAIVATIRGPHSWTSTQTHEEARRRRYGVLLMLWAFGGGIIIVLAIGAFGIIEALH